MGNSHGRHRSESLATKPAHKLQPPAGQPHMRQSIQKEAKANPKKKDNTQQQQKTNSEDTKKGRKKKSKRTSDQPRKGRKESFSKYVPGYVPINPVDEELGGLFDAADYDDPYTIAREKLQNPPKPATMSTTQHGRARYTPPRYQPRVGPTSYQPAHGKTVHQNTKRYYGANANDYLYLDSVCNNHESGEYPYWHHAEDNTEGTSHDDFSCDGNSPRSHDSDTGYGVPPDQIEHHTGGSGDEYGHNDFNYDGDTGGDQDIGGAHDAGGSYDVGVDTGASCDVGVNAGPSYDFGGDTGGGYDCGGSYDAGGI